MEENSTLRLANVLSLAISKMVFDSAAAPFPAEEDTVIASVSE